MPQITTQSQVTVFSTLKINLTPKNYPNEIRNCLKNTTKSRLKKG